VECGYSLGTNSEKVQDNPDFGGFNAKMARFNFYRKKLYQITIALRSTDEDQSQALVAMLGAPATRAASPVQGAHPGDTAVVSYNWKGDFGRIAFVKTVTTKGTHQTVLYQDDQAIASIQAANSPFPATSSSEGGLR